MLIGEYIGKIADKNRIALPKKFRESFKGEIIITRGYEECLIILDEERWNKLINKIESKPFLNRSVRDTKRFIAGGASEVDLDGQGRFIIPELLKSYSQIDKDVIFVGILDWVELWNLEKWNTKIEEIKTSASEIAEKLN